MDRSNTPTSTYWPTASKSFTSASLPKPSQGQSSAAHKQRKNPNCHHRPVYNIEPSSSTLRRFTTITGQAIPAREKQLKGWLRPSANFERQSSPSNPTWRDLSADWGKCNSRHSMPTSDTSLTITHSDQTITIREVIDHLKHSQQNIMSSPQQPLHNHGKTPTDDALSIALPETWRTRSTPTSKIESDEEIKTFRPSMLTATDGRLYH